jgi:transcriptional regulator with XRE-family HTH domain
MPREDKSARAFRDRLEALAGRVGSYYRLAKAAGVSEGTLQTYRNRGSEPSRPILVALAKASGVSVDWLASGESLLNRDILEAIIREIREAEKIENRIVDEKAMAEIIAEVYPEWELAWDNGTKKPDTRKILSIVRKAA